MLKRIIFWLRSVRYGIAVVRQSHAERKCASSWESSLASASEERADDHDLGVIIDLPDGTSYEAVVSYILSTARSNPDFWTIVRYLTEQLRLKQNEAITAIDRTLGGVVRAAACQTKLCPDPTSDPIAWHSFQIASADHTIIDCIYPGLRANGAPNSA